jgi:MFS family permease
MAGTFESLQHRNVRLFFVGLLLSNMGTWIQFTAVAILVDRLTGSTTAIGVLTALQFGPLLFLGAWGGAVVDQNDRRKMTILTQSLLAGQAVTLTVADLTGIINLPVVYGLTFLLGLVSAFDNPARRGFVIELVQPEQISNIVSLNSAVMTGSRIFGPAITAMLVGPIGTGWLFSLNAISFVAIVGSLLLIDESELQRSPILPPGGTPIRDGLRYIRSLPIMFATFIAFAVVSTFGFNHNISLPRMAQEIWGAEYWYGWVLSTISVGSIMGALLTAGRSFVTMRWFIGMTCLLAAGGLAVAWSPTVWMAMIASVPLGMGGAGFVTSMNAITQRECPPEMRGRILALTAVAFLGSFPIGGPITGLVGDYIGLEWSVAYGSIISLLAAGGLAWWALGQNEDRSRGRALRNLLGASTPVAPSHNEHP